MSLALIILIVLLGLAILFVEFFLVPGGGLLGLLGAAIMTGGIYLAYHFFGRATGHVFAFASLAGTLGILIFGFRRIARLGWADKEQIDSRVNEAEFGDLKKGDRGVAFGDLKPGGVALFGKNRIEVFSQGDFIPRGAKVEIVKMEGNKMYVKLVKD